MREQFHDGIRPGVRDDVPVCGCPAHQVIADAPPRQKGPMAGFSERLDNLKRPLGGTDFGHAGFTPDWRRSGGLAISGKR